MIRFFILIFSPLVLYTGLQTVVVVVVVVVAAVAAVVVVVGYCTEFSSSVLSYRGLHWSSVAVVVYYQMFTVVV